MYVVANHIHVKKSLTYLILPMVDHLSLDAGLDSWVRPPIKSQSIGLIGEAFHSWNIRQKHPTYQVTICHVTAIETAFASLYVRRSCQVA
jgi:hypothetical protein